MFGEGWSNWLGMGGPWFVRSPSLKLTTDQCFHNCYPLGRTNRVVQLQPLVEAQHMGCWVMVGVGICEPLLLLIGIMPLFCGLCGP